MSVCDGATVTFCMREIWIPAVLAGFVLLLCLHQIVDFRWPLKRFLTLDEALAHLNSYSFSGAQSEPEAGTSQKPSSRRLSLVFAALCLIEGLVWISVGAYTWITEERVSWGAYIIALTWLYASITSARYHIETPPFDLFALFVLQLVGGVYWLGSVVYDHQLLGAEAPTSVEWILYIGNVFVIFTLLLITLRLPLAVPPPYIPQEAIGVTVSPEDYVPLWKWMTFDWIRPLITRGTRTTLNESDIWALSPIFRSAVVHVRFTELKKPSLLRWLWAANGFDITIDILVTWVSVSLSYSGPFFLKLILDTLEDPTTTNRTHAYMFALLAFCATICKAEADCLHLWFGRRAAARIRASLMCEIHNKSLKRRDLSGIVKPNDNSLQKGSHRHHHKSKKGAEKGEELKAGADVGKIVNLMASDAHETGIIVANAYALYGAPLEIIIAFTFLYKLMGTSAFAGLVVLLLGWPLNDFLRRRAIRIQKGLSSARDKRMSVLNEMISAIKFIKFFAWEEQWIGRAMDSRKYEIKWIVKARTNAVLFFMLYTTAPILVSIVAFATFVARGNELTVSIAFTSIALFNMVRAPLNVIPTWIVNLSQTKVSVDRIQTFLEEEEVTEQVSTLKRLASAIVADSKLAISNASFKWNEVEGGRDEALQADHRFELRDITVNFPKNELTVVTGPTASGKTALLMALLGEMTQLRGQSSIPKDTTVFDEHGLSNSISYAAQSPWLQHQSIRDNILFGSPYDPQRYNAVVECCALRPDLEIFEDGDATEIGAKGVSLSGGQKARVALARAVYSRAKYVLLDDPLSAVDSHTARFLFEKLLCGPLLAHRTVVLVTHHVELVLPGTHYLVRMLDGRIDSQGTVKDLRAAGLLDDIVLESTLEEAEKGKDSAESGDSSKEADDDAGIEEGADGERKKPRKLIKDEKREAGGVKWRIYRTYLKASSYWTWMFLSILIIAAQLCSVSEKLWIKTWGESYGRIVESIFIAFGGVDSDIYLPGTQHLLRSPSQNDSLQALMMAPSFPPARSNPFFYIGVYSGIGLVTALVSVLSVIIQYTGALRASRVLFKDLLVSVVRATMRWHDTTPQGRILNRFTKDIQTVDQRLAGSLNAVNQSLATFLASVITVSIVFPQFLVPAFFLGIIYWHLANGYLNTGRDLRRMESNSRSPIFSGFGEILDGLVTVRAFSSEPRFEDNIRRRIDQSIGIWISFWNTNRWLLLNFDILGGFALLFTSLFSISGSVPAGLAGLCITSAMSFTTAIYWTCRYWTNLELDLNSVERVVEYTQDLPQEPPAIIESQRPPAFWPSSSETESLIVVDDLVVKYAPELPAVLNGISFALRGRERVGLLGRTGSGKSTLAQSLLRFVDPTSGRILVDGVDITSIGVQDLRSQITFIPQDASLFSGTLRQNMDPFQEYSDEECLNALLRVQLIDELAHQSQRSSLANSRAVSPHESVDTLEAPSTTATEVDQKTTITLETQVSAGGANFSQGQKQLIALARALLRSSSIIILDEATSSIDFATDARIQRAIRDEFQNSLLLTVAHRLRTIIDYDRLIVLDNGKVAEIGTPYQLIRSEGGVFHQMCMKSGMFSDLEKMAKKKARRDQEIRRSKTVS